MPKTAKVLTVLKVQSLKEPGRYAVGGVPGLHVYVSPAGARSWVLRAMVKGKRCDIGLGSLTERGLADARQVASDMRKHIKDGGDPLEQRKAASIAEAAARAARQAEDAKALTFEQAARQYIAGKAADWTNVKHSAQWTSTLESYVFPKFGKVLVRDVDESHVIGVLEPIWTSKRETASRLRGRVEAILDWAAARKYRSSENPARWRGHLDKLLGTKPQKVRHHPALPIAQVPAFYAALAQRTGRSMAALRFLMLTATRSGEVRGARWSEIDLAEGLWTIPADRMKAREIHRVPLSAEALELLRAQQPVEGCDFVFPSVKGTALSDMALTKVMRDAKLTAVPHGFRSTFRDWVSDYTSYDKELAEKALAHALANKVEAAYRRGEALEKRRELMEHWADVVAGRRPYRELKLAA